MLHTVCLACIILGIAIPLFTIVLNVFDGFADFIDFDIFELDIDGDFYIDFLPLSVNSLCLWALLFGAFGLMTEGTIPQWLIILIGLFIGYIGAVILQSLIGRLKRVKSDSSDKNELLMMKAIVCNAIPKNGMGAVSVLVSTGSKVSYPAKSYNDESIIQDTEVEIIEVKEEYVLVRSVNYMEEKYDKD